MRLGVLDVGSNTVHLLVVDAHRGAHPTPMGSEKSVLRLAEQVRGGKLTKSGADELRRAVAAAKKYATEQGCQDVMAFATSAIREASNSQEVLDSIRKDSGVELRVLPGEHEARYTFLAARRWYGWSAGRLLVADIGGGSLELATGIDEDPEVAISLPLGAGRLARERLPSGRLSVKQLDGVREWLGEQLAPAVKKLRKAGPPDNAVASSKTFRSLARLAGAAPSCEGIHVRRVLTATGLRQVIGFVSRMSPDDIAELEGVSPRRAHQLVAGALVAEATMTALDIAELDICPWALREGIILRRLDTEPNGESAAQSDLLPATGRTVTNGAR